MSKKIPVSNLLGKKHKGMKVSASGVLGRIRDGWKVDNGLRFMSGEIMKHLEEAAERFYEGDPTGCDEFFQLYCLDEKRIEPIEEES